MPQEYAKKLLEVVHKNQPNALVSGRLGYNLGDYDTLGDMEIPLENREGLWETVDVTNDAWGYTHYDENWKTPQQIIENLVSTIARGGTYMLNVGPQPDGAIPERVAKTLESSGDWVRAYQQVVTNVDASPWKHSLPFGDVTHKGNKLNLVIYKWPDNGRLNLPGLHSTIQSVNLLSRHGSSPLQFNSDGNWTVLKVPYEKPERLVNVIEITLNDVLPTVDPTLGIDSDIATNIASDFMQIKGGKKSQKQWMEKFGEWKTITHLHKWDADSEATITVDVQSAGDYQIDMCYTGEGRLAWQIESEGVSIQNEQNSSSVYTEYPIGWFRFHKAGKHTLRIRLLEGNGDSISLAAIRFTPIVF